MRAYTVCVDPVTQGLVVRRGLLVSRRGDNLGVVLGAPGRASNTAVIPLFKGNVPDLEEDDGCLYAPYAFPVVSKSTDAPSVSLAAPDTDDDSGKLILVRFDLGAQRPPAARGTVWPEGGSPQLYGYACVADGWESWPVWYSDSLWTMTEWDTMLVSCPSERTFIFRAAFAKECV